LFGLSSFHSFPLVKKTLAHVEHYTACRPQFHEFIFRCVIFYGSKVYRCNQLLNKWLRSE
jgi:hypothetical protein